MTDTHTHNEGGAVKMKTVVITRVEKGYRVESVTNSVDYWPPQILEVTEVKKLCDDPLWQVSVIPPIPGRP